MQPDHRTPLSEVTVDRDGELLVYPVTHSGPAYDRLVLWLEQHGIDPERVPMPSTATIRGGMLTVELLLLDDDGQPCLDEHGARTRCSLSVPLVVEPPDCWARREVTRR